VFRFIDDEFGFESKSNKKIGKNSYYGRFRTSLKLLSRQRLLSLNVGSRSKSSRATSGYSDPVFKQCLSRGYVGVNPITRSDAQEISDFGPFYEDSSTVCHVG